MQRPTRSARLWGNGTKSAKRVQAAEELNTSSKTRRGGDGGPNWEAASGCDGSGSEGPEEHDSEREMDAMEAD